MPGQAALCDIFQEGLGRELFDIEHAVSGPFAAEEHRRTGDRWHARRIGNGLRRDFLVGLGMVTDIVQHLRHRLSILGAARDDANGGLAGIAFGQRAWRRQQILQEFHRDDVHPLVLDRFQADQADGFEHFQMLDVFGAKGHPEADLLQALDVLDQAFLFLVIDEV